MLWKKSCVATYLFITGISVTIRELIIAEFRYFKKKVTLSDFLGETNPECVS